jgi:hypothetical protein
MIKMIEIFVWLIKQILVIGKVIYTYSIYMRNIQAIYKVETQYAAVKLTHWSENTGWSSFCIQ